MRYLLLLVLALVAVLYFTIGIKVGMLNLGQAYLFNVTGTTRYGYQTHADDQNVALNGTCDVKSGKATLRFFGPQGQQLQAFECGQKGTFSLNFTGGGKTGDYTLEAEYKKFTGHIKLDENRFGAH